MYILLKLHYANFDISSLFCSKVIEEKPLGCRLDPPPPPPLVKEGLTLSGPAYSVIGPAGGGGGLRGLDAKNQG